MSQDDVPRLARSGLWSIVGHGAQMAGTILLSVIVVRSLTTTEFGELSLARQVTQFMLVLTGLALDRAVLRFVPEIHLESGLAAAIRFARRSMILRVLVWGAISGVVWALGSSLDRWFGAGFGRLAQIAALTVLVFSLHAHLRALASSLFRTRSIAIASSVGSLVTILGTIVALQRSYGAAGVLVAAALGMACAALIMAQGSEFLAGVRPRAGEASSHPGLDMGGRRLWSYASPFAAIAVLNYAVHGPTESFFLSHYMGMDEAGFYAQGFLFAQRLVDFVPVAIWEVSLAGFSRVNVQEPERVPAAFSAYVVLLYLLVLPIAMFGVGFARAATLLLYGEKMLPSVVVAQSYFAIAAISAIGAPIGMIVYSHEKVREALSAYCVFALVNVGLSILLIPRYSIPGAIVAVAAAKLLSVALMSRIAWRLIPQLTVPWKFLLKLLLALSPALLGLSEVLTATPLRSLGTLLGALLLSLLAVRLFGVLGSVEVSLLGRARLPGIGLALRLLASPAARRQAP